MQARSERTRRRLIQAGAEVFDRQGYAHATLGEIAATAGMTKGALYFHFASKDGLADAVQQESRTLLDEFTRRQGESDVAPVQTLIDMTHRLVRAPREEPLVSAGFRITNECVGRQPPVADLYQVWTAEALRLLQQADEAGELHPGARGDGARTLLSALLSGLGALAGTGLPCDELAHRVGALWDLILTVLVPKGQADRYRTGAPGAPEGARRPPDREVETTPAGRTGRGGRPRDHQDALEPTHAQ
ncbi:MAG: ScbR family autoregulator-binding transcription factor [Streptomyces sp.]